MRTDEIVNQVFARSFMGYEIEQVDVFLDEVIETLERYEAEKREMLAAMEYLMKKLERGQKIPFADMKKAIDSGRSQAKPSLPEGEQARDDEQKTAARSIARGNGGANKSMRAPKVSRVKGEEDAKAQIIEEAKAAIPLQELTPEEADKRAKRMSSAAANWLDELLINIAEHESLDYDNPLQGASATQPQPAANVEPVQQQTETTAAEPPESKL
ncbi:MAG: DivIVA domain-containing protein [Eubacteriales bacterium]|jgi:DivIVA domain-containing protein|nr:DivIVA domain-containing protein [Eubacteriales bacterium]